MAQGQRGKVVGSSICRQNSPPSGANGLTKLPHAHTHGCSSHPQINPSANTYADTRVPSYKESTGVQKYSMHRCTLTCSFLHLFACVLFFFFFPLRWSPSSPGTGGKRVPRGWTATLIDSRGFGGRGASKTALPLSLSSTPPPKKNLFKKLVYFHFQ